MGRGSDAPALFLCANVDKVPNRSRGMGMGHLSEKEYQDALEPLKKDELPLEGN